ncbi:MAG: ygdQ [Nitrospira sp.]|nr:ygdQ [Nitrospira sp.]
MLDWLANPEIWIALGTLTALEIVLGIDNIIFISVLVGRLPSHQRDVARRLGLGLAMVARLGLLFSISWVMGLTQPWLTVFGQEISGRDLILIGGGMFLMAKATHEIHNSLEGIEEQAAPVSAASLGMVLVQIGLLDIVFSLDSVITAVGLVDHVSIMAVAIILAVVVMLVAAKSIGDFVDAGLYLFFHGLLGDRRNAEYSHAAKTKGAAQTPQPLCGRPATAGWLSGPWSPPAASARGSIQSELAPRITQHGALPVPRADRSPPPILRACSPAEPAPSSIHA